MGRFFNGQVVGHFWIGLIKAGYIHGVANKDGLATGNNLAFIYPDGETALKGYFENKYMKSAKYVEVQKYGCDENGMFVATEFTKPLRDQSFTSLKADLCQDISGSFAFSRCINGTFP